MAVDTAEPAAEPAMFANNAVVESGTGGVGGVGGAGG